MKVRCSRCEELTEFRSIPLKVLPFRRSVFAHMQRKPPMMSRTSFASWNARGRGRVVSIIRQFLCLTSLRTREGRTVHRVKGMSHARGPTSACPRHAQPQELDCKRLEFFSRAMRDISSAQNAQTPGRSLRASVLPSHVRSGDWPTAIDTLYFLISDQ